MLKDKISKEVVRERLKYPYEIKVRMTERRLSEFITYYGEDGVVASISGGLDSTAAMHFIHKGRAVRAGSRQRIPLQYK